MERRTAAPGQAGFAGPPVRKRTGKRLEISRKTSSLVFREISSLFFCPGALLALSKASGACCLFFNLLYRQSGSRDEPQATACGGCFACGEINRNKQSPLWGVAPIEVADQCPWFRGLGAEEAPGLFVARKLPSCPKASGAYCLLFQVCSIARAGPGPGGSWFGGLGAEEAPDSFVLPEAPAVSSFTQPPRSAWRWKG